MDKHLLTDADKAYIRENYRTIKTKDIAEKIGVTESCIWTYISRQGLSNNRWTKEEDILLERWFGRRTYQQLSEIIGRSPTACQERGRRLGLGSSYSACGDIHVAYASRITGINHVTLVKYCYRGLIKSVKSGQYRYIKEKELFRFMRDNPDKWSALKCEIWFFENEKWFKDKLLEEREIEHQKRWGGMTNGR